MTILINARRCTNKMKQIIKKEMMTIVFFACFNIMVILSRNTINIPEIKFLAIISDIVYSFYLGRLYEFNKLIAAMQDEKEK